MVSHITSLGLELSRRGHSVKVLTPCSAPEPQIDGLDIRSFGRSVPVPTAGSVARISFSVWHEPRLKAMMHDEQFDVVHVHEPLMPMFALMSTYLSPSPTIGTFHAFNEGRGRGYTLWKHVLKRAAERLDARVAVSEAALSFVSRYFPGEYQVIPNGIDFDHYATPLPRPSVFKDDAINLLFVGRLGEKRKGLRYLLGAYSTLKWDYPNLRLVVVGHGTPDPASYRLMGERKIDDVEFVGPVPYSELPSYYQGADIFCSPATGKESFGIVLLEAMAASTPIVATDIPGYAGVMQEGEQGFMVRPRNEEALADAMRRLIDDAALRRRMGESGRHVARQYGWDLVASRVVACYETVADCRPVLAGRSY
ncbi:MAG: glycosyltransferase family 4 protein [Dehalococcoidia bacterium]